MTNNGKIVRPVNFIITVLLLLLTTIVVSNVLEYLKIRLVSKQMPEYLEYRR